jgi:hypothetical protein
MDMTRAERALRAAHEAGDVESARKIAEGIKAMRPAPASTGEVFREQLEAPMQRREWPAVDPVLEQATREVVTQDIPQFARDTFTVPAKQMAHMAISPEEDAAYSDQMIDMLLTGAGGLAGKAIGAPVSAYVKALMRGGQSRFEAARQVYGPAVARAHQPAGATRALAEEWLPWSLYVGSGATAGEVTPDLFLGDIPGPLEGLAGAVLAAGAGPRLANNVMRASPRFAEAALSDYKGNAAQLLGMLLAGGLATAGDPSAPPSAPPGAWRSSVGPNAVPEPRWGRR